MENLTKRWSKTHVVKRSFKKALLSGQRPGIKRITFAVRSAEISIWVAQDQSIEIKCCESEVIGCTL